MRHFSSQPRLLSSRWKNGRFAEDPVEPAGPVWPVWPAEPSVPLRERRKSSVVPR